MPQFNLTVNNSRGIIRPVPTSHLKLDSLPQISESQIVNASSLSLSLIQPAKQFFRHGWQSWTSPPGLTHPISPSPSGSLNSAQGTRILPTRSPRITSARGSVQWSLRKVIFCCWGALELSGRVELDGTSLKGFYEGGHEGRWLITRGKEDEVFARYTSLLEKKFGKTRFEKAPRVWCSWYSLYKWINERVILKALNGIGNLPFGRLPNR